MKRAAGEIQTRLTSIPLCMKGAIDLSEASVSVISTWTFEIGQISAGATVPILLESATTTVC